MRSHEEVGAEPLAEQYEAHGKEVLLVLFATLNRFVEFLRAEKGQFWIAPYRINLGMISSTATEFRAKAQVSGGAWFRWQPSQQIKLLTALPGDAEIMRYLKAEDWPLAQRFVDSKARPNLARQLLASSELLAAVGHERAALTEAIAALEVAVSSFARSPRAHEVLPEVLRKRTGIESLKKLVEHLGLTATVHYLLPVIFPEERLSTSVLKTCREAIAARQSVVHAGQRQIDKSKLKEFLAALRIACDALIQSA